MKKINRKDAKGAKVFLLYLIGMDDQVKDHARGTPPASNCSPLVLCCPSSKTAQVQLGQPEAGEKWGFMDKGPFNGFVLMFLLISSITHLFFPEGVQTKLWVPPGIISFLAFFAS